MNGHKSKPRILVRQSRQNKNKNVWSERHVINYLLTSLAWAVLRNIGPRSFLHRPRSPRSVLPRPRANIPQYGPHARLVTNPKLLRLPWLKKMLFAKLYFFTHFCKQPALESFYYLSYILRQKVKETRQFLLDIVVSRITWKSKYKIGDLCLSYFSFLHCLK